MKTKKLLIKTLIFEMRQVYQMNWGRFSSSFLERHIERCIAFHRIVVLLNFAVSCRAMKLRSANRFLALMEKNLVNNDEAIMDRNRFDRETNAEKWNYRR